MAYLGSDEDSDLHVSDDSDAAVRPSAGRRSSTGKARSKQHKKKSKKSTEQQIDDLLISSEEDEPIASHGRRHSSIDSGVTQDQPALAERPEVAPLTVGAQIEARFGGRAKWFPGSVTAVSAADGSCSVLYADGDREAGVLRRRIRLPGGESEWLPLAKGDAVDVMQGMGAGRCTAGTVQRVNDDGTFYVVFASGEGDWGVPRDRILSQWVPAAIGEQVIYCIL